MISPLKSRGSLVLPDGSLVLVPHVTVPESHFRVRYHTSPEQALVIVIVPVSVHPGLLQPPPPARTVHPLPPTVKPFVVIVTQEELLVVGPLGRQPRQVSRRLGVVPLAKAIAKRMDVTFNIVYSLVLGIGSW